MQELDERPRRRRPKRLWLIGCFVVLAVGALGARTCKRIWYLTDSQRAQARLDIVVGCVINNCSPDLLRSLLQQLDEWPSGEQKEGSSGE